MKAKSMSLVTAVCFKAQPYWGYLLEENFSKYQAVMHNMNKYPKFVKMVTKAFLLIITMNFLLLSTQ